MGIKKYDIATKFGLIRNISLDDVELKRIEYNLNNPDLFMIEVGDTIVRKDAVTRITPSKSQ